MANTESTNVEVRFMERTGRSWLELDYEGLEPPVALLDDLRMTGWAPPVPSPPPHSALDWDHSDEQAGTRYSVRPYRVVGARVEAPEGSGPRRSWTPGERSAYLNTLRNVLERHGVRNDEDAPVPGLPSGGAATEPVSAPGRGVEGAVSATSPVFDQRSTVVAAIDDVQGYGMAVPDPSAALPDRVMERSVGAGTGAAEYPVAAAPTERASEQLMALEVVVPMAAATAVRGHLEARSLEVSASAATAIATGTYRGNTYEEQVPGARLRCNVPEPLLAEVLDVVCRVTGIPGAHDPRVSVVAVDEVGSPAPGATNDPEQAGGAAADAETDPGSGSGPGLIRRGLRLVS